MSNDQIALGVGMNFPGKKLLRHWFWILAFKYPRLRLALTRLLVPSRNIDIHLFGAPLHINTRDEIGLSRAAKMADENVVFRDEVASLLNLALLLQPGDTFVDVGANVGLYTSVLARFRNVFPKKKYVAIEPHPESFERLRKSVDDRDVTLLNIGLSDQSTELAFQPGVTSGVFKVIESDSLRKGMKIRCERLDSLPLTQSDLVVKIDVEEHEWPVLQGAAGLFQNGRIKVVYLDGYSDDRIPALLRQWGFTLFDGRTLTRCDAATQRSLLGIHQTRLQKTNGQ
jgi:FkbM family methyltransferase